MTILQRKPDINTIREGWELVLCHRAYDVLSEYHDTGIVTQIDQMAQLGIDPKEFRRWTNNVVFGEDKFKAHVINAYRWVYTQHHGEKD